MVCLNVLKMVFWHIFSFYTIFILYTIYSYTDMFYITECNNTVLLTQKIIIFLLKSVICKKKQHFLLTLLEEGLVFIPFASSWKVTGFSFFTWCSWFSSCRKFSRSASSVLFVSPSSFFGLGRDLGRNQKGMPDSMITVPVMMKPSHQAPTQRESLWLIVMVSGTEGLENKRLWWRVDPGTLWHLLHFFQEGKGTGSCC